MKITNKAKTKAKKEFFDKLADKLEELYPKGKSKGRSMALVFNAFANIYFEEVINIFAVDYFGELFKHADKKKKHENKISKN